MDDTGNEIKRMSNDDLLLQINCFDPYDVEFARRFRALEARIEALRETEFAAMLAVHCNGGDWNTDYTHDQKALWRDRAKRLRKEPAAIEEMQELLQRMEGTNT